MHSSRNITWDRNLSLALLILSAGFFSCRHSSTDRILMVTELGDVTIEIYSGKAPLTAANFLTLVEQGTYTQSLFYRVVDQENQPDNPVRIEVVQGGLFFDTLVGAYLPVPHETTELTGIKHTDGTLSMARNEPGSASTEFFICLGDQPSLDFGGNRNPDGQGFAAFGRVTSGMEVIRRIHSLPDTGQYLVHRVMIREMKRIR
jgi:peptidyl-prolyl cis-trans isomerase A (cyclophilin A)